MANLTPETVYIIADQFLESTAGYAASLKAIIDVTMNDSDPVAKEVRIACYMVLRHISICLIDLSEQIPRERGSDTTRERGVNGSMG